MRIFIILVFISSCIGYSCAEEELNYTLEVIDGVSNVHNLYPKYESKPLIELDKVNVIGELSGENEKMQFFEPRTILMDSEDNIYVIDTGNHRIVKLNSTGDFLLEFGQKGQGPGEFEYMMSASMDSKENIYVGEFTRTQIFDTAGNYLRSMRLKHTRSFEFTNDDKIIATGFVISGTDTDDFTKFYNRQPVIQVMDFEENIVQKIGKRRFYSDRMMNLHGNNVSLAMDRVGNYYFAYNARNLVEKYSPDGEMIFRSSKETDMIESEEAEQVRTTNKIGEGAIMPMFTRFAKNTGIDGKGRLWVEVYNRRMTIEERKKFQDNTAKDLISLEVYDSDGILLQRIPWEFGNSRPLKLIKGDRMFFIDNNDMRVYEYRIVEKKMQDN